MGSFSQSVRIFVGQAKENTDYVIKTTGLKILARLIEKSPVGNPELWAANQTAVQYNDAVSEYNRSLRNDTSNLTKTGRLKKGRKVNDSMDVRAPTGYTGGRFRGNWQIGFDEPPAGETDRIDPGGNETLLAGGAILSHFSAAQNKAIYFVNNVPYAVRLEFGYSKQAPAGMVRVTAEEFQQLFSEAARQIK